MSYTSRSAGSRWNWRGLKKVRTVGIAERRMWIENSSGIFSMRQQCELAGVTRSGLYYEPAEETVENLLLMRLLDEQYTATPFYGVARMTAWLRQEGYMVNPKRIRRLMRRMGLDAIYAKPQLSKPAAGHRIYPYLLRGLAITRANQVWSTDITYIRLRQGFIYLVLLRLMTSRFGRDGHIEDW